jgi:transposase
VAGQWYLRSIQCHKQFVDKVVLRFRLSERVPQQNLYRRLAELLDWDFLYAQTRSVYSHTGQPSLDPVVFFKFVLVSRLENISSDRRLVEHYSLRLDILYFLGYEVDEDLPWHSTISSTRQLYPAAIFEHLFDHVFAQCVAAGLVAGNTQTVDSAPVKANASLDRVCEKQDGSLSVPRLEVAGQLAAPPSTPAPATLRSAPAHQLRYEVARQAKRAVASNSQRVERVMEKVTLGRILSPSVPPVKITLLSVKYCGCCRTPQVPSK